MFQSRKYMITIDTQCIFVTKTSLNFTMAKLLPIESRIQYNICLLVHLSLNGKASSYISSLIQPVFTLSTRFLPRSRLKFGERAFRIVVPKVWNTLPLNVRQISNTQTFKRNLKTFLFCTSYNIPTPTLSPQTDILCGFLIVIVSLYSIVF